MPSRAAKENAPIVWSRNRGRNGWDGPSDVSPDMSTESFNIDLVQNALGRRRNGSVRQPVTGNQDAPAVLARFSPTLDDRNVELHYTTLAAGVNRVAVNADAEALALVDAISDPRTASWAVLNRKLFWSYDSAVNRLHVYDPATPGVVRRAGLPADPSVITVADTGSGTYPAVLRQYRTRLMRLAAGGLRLPRAADGTLVLQGEAGAAVSFTPSGTGAAATVTRPVGGEESATHWRVEVSLDGATWYVLSAPIPIATTTYADSTLVTAYGTLAAAPIAGTFAPFPSVKYLCADQDRLLGFGAWEAGTAAAAGEVAPRAGRVYFTPVLSSTDSADDERIDYGPDHPGFIDVGRAGGYEDRALAGPIDGQFMAFQSQGIHLLVPTGDVENPFRRITLSPKLGAVSHASTFIGEDEAGAVCLYFLDPARGPYRYGPRGLEWCGYDVQDVWAFFNPDAPNLSAHGYFDSTLRAAIWFISVSPSTQPDQALVFFVREGQPTEVEGVRYGYSRWIAGPWAGATSSLAFARTLDTPRPRGETGYLATSAGLMRINVPGTIDDAGVPFLAQMASAEFQPARLFEKTPTVAYVQASAHADPIVTIRHGVFGDFLRVGQGTNLVLTPERTEQRVMRKVPDLALGQVTSIRVILGDPTYVSAATWTIDDWLLLYETGGDA
jgi:hypothetical protein